MGEPIDFTEHVDVGDVATAYIQYAQFNDWVDATIKALQHHNQKDPVPMVSYLTSKLVDRHPSAVATLAAIALHRLAYPEEGT